MGKNINDREADGQVYSIDGITKIGNALSNPVRIKILHILNKKPCNIYELAKLLNMSRPVVYANLKKLEDANLIENDLILEGSRAKRVFKAKKFKFKIDNNTIDEIFR